MGVFFRGRRNIFGGTVGGGRCETQGPYRVSGRRALPGIRREGRGVGAAGATGEMMRWATAQEILGR